MGLPHVLKPVSSVGTQPEDVLPLACAQRLQNKDYLIPVGSSFLLLRAKPAHEIHLVGARIQLVMTARYL